MTMEADASLELGRCTAFEFYDPLLGGAATDSGGGGPANVSLTRSGTGIVLEWEGGGSLQTAPAVTGPWSEVSGASSGDRGLGSEAYYRVRTSIKN